MTFQAFASRAFYLLLVLGGVWALWVFREVWLLVFLAAVIAVGVSIPVGYLQRLGVPRPLAVALAALGLLGMLSVFFVAEPKVYVRVSLYLSPLRHHPKLLALWSACYDALKTWLSTLLLSISLTVALVWLVLGALGLPNILVVAVFAGLATFVPNIGVFLPLVPITAFSLLADPDRLLLFVLCYLAIQLLESNVLTPALVRRQLSIPPAATLTFQIIMGFVSGVVGILLAVPLLAVGIVLVRELYSFGFLEHRGRDLEVSLPPPAVPPRDTRSLRWPWARRSRRSRRRARGGGRNDKTS